MISRIRIEAIGVTADEVERTLYPHADEIEKLLGVTVCRGECVIERDVAVPDGGFSAFTGRLLLYPDVSPKLAGTASNTAGASVTVTSNTTTP